MDRDTKVVQDLVAAQGSLPELIAAASSVARFNVPARAQVTANAILSVLDRWDSGEINTETLQAWAEAVGEDWSEDVEADPAQAYEISMSLLAMSSPLLEGPFTAKMAAGIRADLGASVELTATEVRSQGTEPSVVGARLIVVCGLPGSGKTTFAKALETRLRAVRLSPDDWLDALSIDLYDEEKRAQVESLQWTLAQELLARGLIVVIEWGSWARSERDTLRLRARAVGAAVELHYLAAPADVLFARVQARSREQPPINRDDISRWLDVFEEPTPEEIALFDEPL